MLSLLGLPSTFTAGRVVPTVKTVKGLQSFVVGQQRVLPSVNVGTKGFLWMVLDHSASAQVSLTRPCMLFVLHLPRTQPASRIVRNVQTGKRRLVLGVVQQRVFPAVYVRAKRVFCMAI